MVTKLPVENFVYLADFAYVKAKEVWPTAVILDRRADVRFCRSKAQPNCGYGFDIFQSEADIELLLSGDCYTPPPSVNISWECGEATLIGDDALIKHLAQQPLWSSR